MLDIFSSVSSEWLLGGVFVAGLFSIAHCSVMCGPIAILFGDRRISYHTGRIIGYSGVGAVLGLIGQSLDQAGSLVSIQNTSMYFAAVIMILYGIYQLIPARWMSALYGKGPSFLFAPARWMGRLKKNKILPSSIAVFIAGVLSALIPCSVLYPVWALAAGAGSPAYGSSVALAFVLGTIPGLYVIQTIAMGASKRFNQGIWRGLRVASVVFLIFSGVFLIGYRDTHARKLDFSSDATAKEDESCLPEELGNSPSDSNKKSNNTSSTTDPGD